MSCCWNSEKGRRRTVRAGADRAGDCAAVPEETRESAVQTMPGQSVTDMKDMKDMKVKGFLCRFKRLGGRAGHGHCLGERR